MWVLLWDRPLEDNSFGDPHLGTAVGYSPLRDDPLGTLLWGLPLADHFGNITLQTPIGRTPLMDPRWWTPLAAPPLITPFGGLPLYHPPLGGLGEQLLVTPLWTPFCRNSPWVPAKVDSPFLAALGFPHYGTPWGTVVGVLV